MSPVARLSKINWRRLARFARFVLERCRRDRLSMMAASLTFTTLLALVPLLTIVLSLIAAFPLFSGVVHAFQAFLFNNLVPGAAAKIVSVYLQQFTTNAARLTALGVVFLALTAFLMMHTIERAFNIIWQVRRTRPFSHRILLYWAAISLGPLVLGLSLSGTSILVHSAATKVPIKLLWGIVSASMMSAVFTLLYTTVANRYVPLKHALIGGITAGIAFELTKRAFGYYIGRFGNYELVYGAFSAVPIFLIWVYMSWHFVLGGAVLTACLAQWRNGHWQVNHIPGGRFWQALLALQILYHAQIIGETVSTQYLHDRMGLGFEEMDDLMHRLERLRLVTPAQHHWTLSRRLDQVRLMELYRHLAFEASLNGMPEETRTPWLRTVAENMQASHPAILDRTLAEILEDD